MFKSLPRVIYHATKVLLKAIRRSIVEEIEISKEAAKIRYSDPKLSIKNKLDVQNMDLEEAKMILNVEKICQGEIEQKFKLLFEANSKNLSGSFYLQSKVYRAKQRLDSELDSKDQSANNHKK